jgi:vesicular inhibitory amino acid transporter
MKEDRFGGVNYGTIELEETSLSPSSSSSSSQKCSVLEAASNQIAVVTGAGMLSLPFAASAVGWSVLLLLFCLTIAFCYSYLLLVYSIEKVREIYEGSPVVVDYTLLGRESFGVGGDKFVLAILISELFLALVSFFINIALNLIVIFPSVTMTTAIILSALLTFGLSLANMKFLSRVTGVGNIMTILTVLALALSGIFLPPNPTPLQYKFFDPSGIAVSLGVMAYCFGGHGALYVIICSLIHSFSPLVHKSINQWLEENVSH